MTIVQYIVLRRDLLNEHGEGFLATQTAHASLAPITSRIRKSTGKSIEDVFDQNTLAWINGTFTKIVLEVPDETGLNQLRESLNKGSLEYSEIRESRLNGALTGIGLKPYEKEAVCEYFQGLKLLR